MTTIYSVTSEPNFDNYTQHKNETNQMINT